MCLFLNARNFSRLPRFRLLVKSHKSLDLTSEGRWASRPLVGLAGWAMSSASVIMARVGQMILKLVSRNDPLSTPLRDTMDLLSRVRSQVEELGTAHRYVLTNYDFNALYTRVSWRHIHEDFNWWHQWCNGLSDDQPSCLSNYERDLLPFFFQPVSSEDMQRMKTELPFLSHVYDCRTLGWWLLNFIFHHTVFCNPGVGVYRQTFGFSMGTNAAPPWAHLVLRSYEGLKLLASAPIFRFQDDGLVLHKQCDRNQVTSALCDMYPEDLSFQFDTVGCQKNITFLDVHFIPVLPLKTVVYWKPTHVCSYLPWHANAPRHTHESWVFGEYLRYIRICSHEYLCDSCCKCLQAALVCWRYTQRVRSEKYIEWTHRGKYMTTRAQRLRCHCHCHRWNHR